MSSPFTSLKMTDLNKTVIAGEEGDTWRSVRGSLNSVIAFVATLLIAWIIYRLLQVAKTIAEVFILNHDHTHRCIHGRLMRVCQWL